MKVAAFFVGGYILLMLSPVEVHARASSRETPQHVVNARRPCDIRMDSGRCDFQPREGLGKRVQVHIVR